MTILRDRPERPERDTIDDVQIRGLSRWSPRRAGLPALMDWWPAYFLIAALAVLAVLVTGRLLVDVLSPMAHVIVVAGVAAVLTFALSPLVARLEQHMPRRAAAAVVFFGTLLAILALAAVVVVQLATGGDRLTQQLADVNATLEGRRTLTIGPYVLPPALERQARDLVVTQAPNIAQHTAEFAVGFLSSLIDLVLVLVVTFYLLLDARRFQVLALRWFEPDKRPALRRVFSEVAHVFGAYVRAQLTVATSLGVLVALAMWVIGVPYALFLGLFAALAELIPMIGPFVGAVPALLIALTLPFPAVAWVALAFLVIQQIESNFLLPRLSAHAVGIHPIGSILALVLGFEVGGIVGALFAVPIAGLLWVLLSTAVSAWRDRRQELQRNMSGQTLGRPDSRSRARVRGRVRHLRPQ